MPAGYRLILISLSIPLCPVFLIFLPEIVILVLYYSIIFHFRKCLIIYKSPPLPEISKNFKHSLRSMSSDFLLYIINYSGLTVNISQIVCPVSDVQFYSVIPLH